MLDFRHSQGTEGRSTPESSEKRSRSRLHEDPHLKAGNRFRSGRFSNRAKPRVFAERFRPGCP